MWCFKTKVGWASQPTNNAKGVARRVGIPAHRNGRNVFRLPETIFCHYIVFCRYGGLEAHPTIAYANFAKSVSTC
ncbi:MAG: hypothetical protein IKZ88_06570 [Neisseriaceae bacterium]|nr:hypothetical protein [Neisseriaceae bacterium]